MIPETNPLQAHFSLDSRPPFRLMSHWTTLSRSSNETYCYKGQEFSLSDTEYSVCRECGFDVVLPHQKRQNEARIRDEHRRIDRLLTGRQIKAIRKRLGLRQAEAA